MHLLLTDPDNDQLKLVTVDNPENPPPYAILSHTWVKDEEISLQDVQSNNLTIHALSGYQKILGCCRQARKAGYKYVWIDTCCIDKTSSAELSEAINSMYKWYRDADVCIVYLHDVLSPEDPKKERSQFRRSRWFTRGWTLLIAPKVLEFYNSTWVLIGDKEALAQVVESITGIGSKVLCCGYPLDRVSIATKMSWAAKRETTRVEDRAYSLLGLFGVNMATIYGEGRTAFTRLQYEIMALSADHSIFAWNIEPDPPREETPILADSPDRFSKSLSIVDIPHDEFAKTWKLETTADTSRKPHGIQATLPIFKLPNTRWMRIYHKRDIDAIAVIACQLIDFVNAQQYSLGIALRHANKNGNSSYIRVQCGHFVHVDSLVNMGVPWTVEPLILEDRRSASEDNTADQATPSVDITINAHTLDVLCDSGGGFVFVPSPTDANYADFKAAYGSGYEKYQYHTSTDMSYVRTEVCPSRVSPHEYELCNCNTNMMFHALHEALAYPQYHHCVVSAPRSAVHDQHIFFSQSTSMACHNM